jgi:hypothetical protein
VAKTACRDDRSTFFDLNSGSGRKPIVGAADGPIIRLAALIQVNADCRVVVMTPAGGGTTLPRPAAVPFSDPAFATIRVDFRRCECDRRQRRLSDARRQGRPDNKHGGMAKRTTGAMNRSRRIFSDTSERMSSAPNRAAGFSSTMSRKGGG